MPLYVFNLYITGRSPRSLRAVHNLRRICAEHLGVEGVDYRLELVDVLEHPELAESEHIFATPVTLRLAPPPLCRVIGDLSDPARVLAGLGVDTRGDSSSDSEPT